MSLRSQKMHLYTAGNNSSYSSIAEQGVEAIHTSNNGMTMNGRASEEAADHQEEDNLMVVLEHKGSVNIRKSVIMIRKGQHRRTSLTVMEAGFLKNLEGFAMMTDDDDVDHGEEENELQHEVRAYEQEDMDYEDDDSVIINSLVQAQEALHKSIAQHKLRLTSSESEFLTELMQNPNVTEAELTAAQNMLDSKAFQDITTMQSLLDDDSDDEGDNDDVVAGSSDTVDKSDREDLMEVTLLADRFRADLWNAVQSSAGEEVDFPTRNATKAFRRESSLRRLKPSRAHSFVYSMILNRSCGMTGPCYLDEEKQSKADEHNSDSQPVEYSILGTSIDQDCHQPHVLNPTLMEALRPHLPFVVQQDNFWLKYSMQGGDGADLLSLWNKIRRSSRTLFAIETMDGDVFGCFVSSPWRHEPSGYFGSGEAFLWRLKNNRHQAVCINLEDRIRLESNIEVFRWTGMNRNVQRMVLPQRTLSKASLMIGSGGPDSDPAFGGGVALTFGSMLTEGSSDSCPHTFGLHEPLCKNGDPSGNFGVANLEVWTLTPVDDIEDAAKLELGRQFIFEQGKFVQQ